MGVETAEAPDQLDGVEELRTALQVLPDILPHSTTTQLPAAAADKLRPKVVFLWFADGGPAPMEGSPCAGKTPTAYTCAFGSSVDDCKRQVMAHLDRWYEDFNVVFTFTKPVSGPHYTVIVTSDGAWCDQGSGIGGLAPINCLDLDGGTAYAFVCRRAAKTCASIIAQEQAHTVGLAHTLSRADVMYPIVQATSEGFEDKENQVESALCRATQNSHALMAERLGRWTGGNKPDPFENGTLADAGAFDDGGTVDRGGGGVVRGAPTTSGSGVGSAGSTGLITRVVPDAAAANPAATPDFTSAGGGCTFGPTRPSRSPAGLARPLGVLLAFVSVRPALRRGRRADGRSRVRDR